MHNRVIHFEIQTKDPEKAAKFYAEVFSWNINEMQVPGVTLVDENRYWVVMTAPENSTEPGINGGILFRRSEAPKPGQGVNAFVCTVGVEDIHASVEKALSAGATQALPTMAIPGIGWQAYCTDPDGNIFGIHQADPAAK